MIGTASPETKRLIFRNIAILWVLFGVLLATSQLLPSVGSSTLRSALIGLSIVLGLAVGLRFLITKDNTSTAGENGLAFNAMSLVLFLIGLAIGLSMIGLQLANLYVFGGEVAIIEGTQLDVATIVFTLLSFLAWAIVEELGFRSYSLFRLNDAWGFWPAQLFIALVFAIYHIVAGFPWHLALFGTTVGSLAFGAVAVATRGVALPIGLHAAWNIGEWLVGGKSYPSPWQLDIGEDAVQRVQIAGGIGYYVLYGTVIVLFIVYNKRKKSQLNSDR